MVKHLYHGRITILVQHEPHIKRGIRIYTGARYTFVRMRAKPRGNFESGLIRLVTFFFLSRACTSFRNYGLPQFLVER